MVLRSSLLLLPLLLLIFPLLNLFPLSTTKILLNLFPKEPIMLRLVFNRLLPRRPTKLLIDTDDILEVVKREYPRCLVQNKLRQDADLQVDTRGHTHLAALLVDGRV